MGTPETEYQSEIVMEKLELEIKALQVALVELYEIALPFRALSTDKSRLARVLEKYEKVYSRLKE